MEGCQLVSRMDFYGFGVTSYGGVEKAEGVKCRGSENFEAVRDWVTCVVKMI